MEKEIPQDAARKLLEALSGILEICESRWRALPATSPEKQRIVAARLAIAAAEGS